MTLTVGEIMAAAPIMAHPETAIEDIARIMRDEDIGTVLIGVDGDLIGVVTDRDLVVRSLAAGRSPGSPVRQACSEQLWSVDPDTEVVRAAELMRAAAVRRLPVVKDGKAVGVVSLGDIAALGAPDSVLGGISAAMPNS